jgi:D-arabinose 1-dehydrogenase-like Zn-dependent alcohol dehydrogenase
MIGRHFACINSVQFDSGNLDECCFGTAVAWDVSTIINVLDEIASEHASPLACGGVTVFGPSYQNDLKPGDRMGVIGMGGLDTTQAPQRAK